MGNPLKKASIIPVVLAAIVCLVLKISCYAVSQTIVYPHDQPLIVLSCVYCVSLGILCFFCGKTKVSSILAAAVLGLEILTVLMAVATDGRGAFVFLYRLAAVSDYALMELVHSFENIGQTIRDWWYFAAFAAGHLVFIGIILMGRKLLAKGRN